MNRTTLTTWLLIGVTALAAAAPKPKKPKKPTFITGQSRLLRAMPKRFARLLAVEPGRRRVTLLVEGENLAKVWSVLPDAEVKVHGFWGRLDQLHVNDRVWAWFHLSRDKQPDGIMMLADELSEQDMIGGVTVESATAGEVKVKSPRGGSRTLKIAVKDVRRGKASTGLDTLKPGERIFVQTAQGKAQTILDADAFEMLRGEQKAALRQRWLSEGLPGRVLFPHVTGELEYLLDHEALRWGRSLAPGTKVTLRTARPIPATVREVRPWRERTLVRLITTGLDQADLAPGQRVALVVPAPPAKIDDDPLPPGRGKAKSKSERIEWFLANIYCTCKVRGDGCTGHFYTLASCNPNTCGMPNRMRQTIGGLIDKGLSDDAIFKTLQKEHGHDLLRPHLLP